ncbi:Tfp pilus assembly protein FimT [Thermosyntropha lipolytica DSM 11003]|uniref:Tfp pilus assembly protein FimT n=1 Tax=Thermosyntropha lipolytica DSM 11003 TaxID=1123382 RepID=A0A1M5LPR9_9FIRM|nr:Tfp pilus assembly protein FimT [Thermosyntropha lipolytica DSM 11003]
MLAFIAVFAFLSVPRWEKVKERHELEAEARKVAWILREARQDAIMSGEVRKVVFYPLASKYRDHNGGWHELRTGIKMAVNFNTITGTPACVFSPNGAPNGGTVTLIGKSQLKRYVVVSPVTGRVRVADTPPDNW